MTKKPFQEQLSKFSLMGQLPKVETGLEEAWENLKKSTEPFTAQDIIKQQQEIINRQRRKFNASEQGKVQLRNMLDERQAEIESKDDAIHILNNALSEQKDFIERLTGARKTDPMDFCGVLCRYSEKLINEAKAEAVKEFVERLESLKKFRSCMDTSEYEPCVTMREVDIIKKEMAKEN